MDGELTQTIEEYLEGIYRLQERWGIAKTGDLVKLFNVSPGTVTNTIERLERKGFIVHSTYKGVRLTEKGLKIALKVIRKHRLSERLLTDVLQLEWHESHEAACQLEHSISDKIAKKIEELLGYPKTCPHGNPIPTENGRMIERENLQPLVEAGVGEERIIARITSEEPELLKYFNRLGLKPERSIEIIEKAPFNGPLTIKIGESIHALDHRLASIIMVKKGGGG